MARKVMQRFYDDKGNLVSKECCCCHEIKSVSEFSKQKGKKDGLCSKCKECYKQYCKDNAEKIKEQQKQYYENNTEEIKERHKKYCKDNAEKIKEQKKQYRKDNAEKIKEQRKQYRKDNAKKVKEQQKQYYENNAKKVKERQKQYYENNAEKIKEYNKQYRKDNAEHYKQYNKQYNTKQVQEALQQIKIEVESNPEKYNYIENKKIYGIIYLVHNINSDKYYVGQTTVGFDNRYPSGWLYEHSKKDTVKHDLELYGENSFEYIKLFKVAHSQYELDKLEAYYIDYYNSYENGYNENRGNIFTDRGKEK